MGIKGLETFIRENSNENIAHDVNIRDAIVEWQRGNGERNPTVIINLVHFVKVLAKFDRNTLIMGGQYDTYNKKISKFFGKLQDLNANLVFFCRPFLNDIDEEIIANAYDHAVRNSLPQFQADQLKIGRWSPCHLDKRFLYNLIKIASDYGEIYTQLKGEQFNIVEYAREHNADILAVIDSDTDLLLFDGRYQYWNLADLDILQCKIKMFCPNKLYERLQLNTQQMQMLAALSRLKGDCIPKFVRNIETAENSGKTIFKLATYVRSLNNLGSLERIAADIFGDDYTEEQLKEIHTGLARYQMPEPDNLNGRSQNFRDFVEFCKRNLCFAYGLAVETVSTNQALAFIDLRRPDATGFIQVMLSILMKQCGIVLKDVEERPSTRTVKIKRTVSAMNPSFANNNDQGEEIIIYPPMDLPSLHQMIIQEKNTSFDESRWSLFQWILDFDDQFILNVRNNFESNFMRIVSYTLKFLLLNKSISFREADIIFLAEWNLYNHSTYQNQRITSVPPPVAAPNRNVTPLLVPVNWRESTNYMLPMQSVTTVNFQSVDRRPPLIISNWRDRNNPNERRPHNWSNCNSRVRTNLPTQSTDPKFIDRTWIQTAHKYTIAFESVCHCLELCGLRNETDLIRFDALDFHAKMRLNKRGNEKIDGMVAKIRNIRFYC